MSGALEANLDVVGVLSPVNFTPTIRHEAAQAAVSGLAQLVATGHLHKQTFVPNLEMVRHSSSVYAIGDSRRAYQPGGLAWHRL